LVDRFFPPLRPPSPPSCRVIIERSHLRRTRLARGLILSLPLQTTQSLRPPSLCDFCLHSYLDPPRIPPFFHSYRCSFPGDSHAHKRAMLTRINVRRNPFLFIFPFLFKTLRKESPGTAFFVSFSVRSGVFHLHHRLLSFLLI